MISNWLKLLFKGSPDVETTGLLVKALISSDFKNSFMRAGIVFVKEVVKVYA